MRESYLVRALQERVEGRSEDQIMLMGINAMTDVINQEILMKFNPTDFPIMLAVMKKRRQA